MNLKEIREELLQAAELIADYEQAHHYLDIDTAMVKIRRAYEALRFYEFGQIDVEHPSVAICRDNQQVEEQESDKEIEVEILMSDWEEDEPIDNDNSEADDAASEETATEIDEQSEQEVQEVEQAETSPEEPTVEQEVEEPAPIAESAPEEEQEPASEELPETEPVVVQTPGVETAEEPMSEVEPVVEPTPEPTPESVKPKRVVIEPSLFGDDDIWGRPTPTTSRRKIMSLYGEEIAEQKPRHRRKSAAVEPEPPVVASKSEDVPSAVVESEQKAESQLPTEPGTVLADTIATPTTIADTIPSQPRVGESGAVETLRSSISVGDRFMLIRELFGGNESEYESTIDKLEEMDNLDDCIIYIAENFAWRASSVGAKLIMDLLQRKLC